MCGFVSFRFFFCRSGLLSVIRDRSVRSYRREFIVEFSGVRVIRVLGIYAGFLVKCKRLF